MTRYGRLSAVPLGIFSEGTMRPEDVRYSILARLPDRASACACARRLGVPLVLARRWDDAGGEMHAVIKLGPISGRRVLDFGPWDPYAQVDGEGIHPWGAAGMWDWQGIEGVTL